MIEIGKNGEILSVPESNVTVDYIKNNLKTLVIQGILNNQVIDFILPVESIEKLYIENGKITVLNIKEEDNIA